MSESDPTRTSAKRRDPAATQTSKGLRGRAVPEAGAGDAAPRRVGRHEILEELGRGGMGVVYRARDTRLHRLVALKALPNRVASNPEARERFEREARLLAALEHPHVAAIYGIEEGPEGAFLVLQHVEGESLASCLSRGPLATGRALEIASQVASGIAAAHRRDIVHCDLKPANVMLVSDGTVKLVDFGIATRFRGSALGDDGDGRSLGYGTPAYMSPEQIAGLPLDPRTDIWSFGCTLFECLSGRLPFEDDNVSILLARIEKLDPDWSLLPPGVPSDLRDLLVACLAKDRDRRPPDMEAIRRRLAIIARPEPSPSARPPLPRSVSAFIGRERDLSDVSDLLDRERLVTLTGSAGCGKTRLLLEAARRREGDLPSGAWFAGLASLADPAHVAQAIVTALGVRRDGGSAEAAAVAALRDQEGLLILDNCEHLLREVARLAELLLSSCPRLRIACTSREALGIPGEVAWRVPSLDVPEGSAATSAAALATSDACALFLARAREARPDFVLDDACAPAVAAILARLDGIPLAIELAAARLRILTPEQILERLSDRFRLLTGGSRTALERHQTLRAALDWSYGLLGPDEQRCLRELSVFAGGFRLEEAAATCTGDEFEVLDLVSSLVAKSLVQAEIDARRSPRYRLLDSVRQHAAAKLEDAGEAEAVRNRHLSAFVAFVRESRRALDTDDPSVMRRLDVEHDNIRTALEWALARPGTVPAAHELATRLAPLWDNAGRWREGFAWLERVRDAPGCPGDATSRAALASGLGRMMFWLGRHAEALAALSEAVALQEETGDARAAAATRMQVAMIPHLRGELRAAREAYVASLHEAESCGDEILAVETLLNLCTIERDLGMPDDARVRGEQALARGGMRREARARRLLGILARDRGDIAEARRLIARALELHEARHEMREAAASRVDLGHVAVLEGAFEEAIEHFAWTEQSQREWGDVRGHALALANRGLTEGRLGRRGEARATLVRALELLSDMDLRTLKASIVAAHAQMCDDDDAALATRSLGCVSAARDAMGRKIAGRELTEMEEALARLRTVLGDASFEAAWSEGVSADLDATIAALLRK